MLHLRDTSWSVRFNQYLLPYLSNNKPVYDLIHSYLGFPHQIEVEIPRLQQRRFAVIQPYHCVILKEKDKSFVYLFFQKSTRQLCVCRDGKTIYHFDPIIRISMIKSSKSNEQCVFYFQNVFIYIDTRCQGQVTLTSPILELRVVKDFIFVQTIDRIQMYVKNMLYEEWLSERGWSQTHRFTYD